MPSLMRTSPRASHWTLRGVARWVDFTFVNPEDDEHNFVLPGLVVELPGKSVTRADWRAERAGIFTFVCTVPAHMPEMYGQLVVLPAGFGAGFSAAPHAVSH
jgi:hypothetical protein